MSMLEKIVERFEDRDRDVGMLVDPAVTRLTYIGYETNPVMIDECMAKLESMGFTPVTPSKDDNENNMENPDDGERVYEGFFAVQSMQSHSKNISPHRFVCVPMTFLPYLCRPPLSMLW
mmetsp:Transcript_15247/g.34148  ORF Transcript_15247/g.34148 Transcript_15247/m.34148 type:complete len:119 (+) Transcript_15247:1170-1526(+)